MGKKYWLSKEEKEILYWSRHPAEYRAWAAKEYKKKGFMPTKMPPMTKALAIKINNEMKSEKKPIDLRPICYECGIRFDYRANQQPLPHNYCPDCYTKENFAMQCNLNRMPIEVRRKHEAYVRAGIIGWYDWSPETREEHDIEMQSYRQGMMKVSEVAYDDLEVNKEYLKQTLGSGEERKSLEIADNIINHLDWDRINLNRRRRHWKNLLSSLKEQGVHIKRIKIQEKVSIPSLEFQMRSKDLAKYISLNIGKDGSFKHSKDRSRNLEDLEVPEIMVASIVEK